MSSAVTFMTQTCLAEEQEQQLPVEESVVETLVKQLDDADVTAHETDFDDDDDDSDQDDVVVTAQHQTSVCATATSSPLKKKKSVRFKEMVVAEIIPNHDATTALNHEETETAEDGHDGRTMRYLWYTPQQILEMGQGTGEFARCIVAMEEGDCGDTANLWSRSYRNLYQRILSYNADQAEADADEDDDDDDDGGEETWWSKNKHELLPDLFFNVERLGMEGGAVSEIGLDAAQRRKQIRQVVTEYQKAPIADDELLSTLIRQECCHISRPSRLFAVAVAAAAAASATEE